MIRETRRSLLNSRRAFAAKFPPVLAALVVFGVLSVLTLDGCSRAQKHPNVLLITLDTTRADRLGCYGYTNALTPNLDRLAADGARFAAMETVAPITLPAHATMLTGLHPPEHGARLNGDTTLAKDVPTITSVFRKEGYRTAAIIAFTVLSAKYGLSGGFDLYDAPPIDPAIEELMHTPPQFQEDGANTPYRRGDKVADAALAWLRGDGRKGRPWFLWVHFYDAHMPLHWNRKDVGPGFKDPYDAEIAFMDRQVGRLLDYLDQTGQKERTLVVAVADHGEGLGQHGEPGHTYLLYESTTHVPCLVRYPACIPGGQVHTNNTSLVQLAPTVLDLAGLRPTAEIAHLWGSLGWLDEKRTNEGGKECRSDSLAPALRESRSAANVLCHGETDNGYFRFGWAPLRSVRVENWKYIRAPRAELYNLSTDPQETSNLVDVETNRARALEHALREREDIMVRRKGAEVKLDEREWHQMESLGYAAGKHNEDSDTVDYRLLPDVKLVLPAMTASVEVARRIDAGDVGDRTLEMATNIVAISPGSAEFHAQLGRLLQLRGNSQGAIAAYRSALRLTPARPDFRANLGVIYAKGGQLDLALEQFRDALRLQPGSAEAKGNLAQALNDAARQAVVRKEYAQGEKLVMEGKSLEPANPGWDLSLAGVKLEAGQRDAAISILKDLVATHPNYRSALDALRRLEQK